MLAASAREPFHSGPLIYAVFPRASRWRNTSTGAAGLHHIDESRAQAVVKDAVGNAGIAKRATCHTFRYSFAAPLSEVEQDIRIVQELLARQDERTHVMTRGVKGVRSLADTLR